MQTKPNLMYECRNKCLCARCINVNGNCATCDVQFKNKISKDIVKQCVSGGVKECKHFKELKEEK